MIVNYFWFCIDFVNICFYDVFLEGWDFFGFDGFVLGMIEDYDLVVLVDDDY